MLTELKLCLVQVIQDFFSLAELRKQSSLESIAIIQYIEDDFLGYSEFWDFAIEIAAGLLSPELGEVK